MEAQIAAAKGIEPCPMCGSADVRWRGRRPMDFALNWMRWVVELFASLVSGLLRGRRREYISRDGAYLDKYDEYTYIARQNANEVAAEMREAATGHRTPRVFWKCSACGREGHVF